MSLVDARYTGEPFAGAIQEILGATVEVVKRSELHAFAAILKRWVVERSFSWLEKCHSSGRTASVSWKRVPAGIAKLNWTIVEGF